MSGSESEGDRLDGEWPDPEPAELLTIFGTDAVTDALIAFYQRQHRALVVLSAADVATLHDLLDSRLDVFRPGTDYANSLAALKNRLTSALYDPPPVSEAPKHKDGPW